MSAPFKSVTWLALIVVLSSAREVAGPRVSEGAALHQQVRRLELRRHSLGDILPRRHTLPRHRVENDSPLLAQYKIFYLQPGISAESDRVWIQIEETPCLSSTPVREESI